MRDPWGLDRSESRYVTQEFRTAALAPAPEPHQHLMQPWERAEEEGRSNGH